MSFPRYPAYKPSGVEWLGEVPEHWVPNKICAISSLKGRLGWQGLKADEYREQGPYVVSSAHFQDRRIQWEECPRVSQERYETDENIQLAANDVLLMKDGAAMGKLAFIDQLPGPACLNSHLLLFRPREVGGAPAFYPKFAFYFMQTGYFQEHIRINGTGATFLGISQDAIGRYQICLPSLPEQAHIVTFLSHETAKIDALIAEQQRLIELLREKRQAVISRAVTKGLNPHAPMKDSGVEWLGEVPEHWEIKQVRHLLKSLSQGSSPNCLPDPAQVDEYGVLKVGCVNGMAFLPSENKALPAESQPDLASLIQQGDVLMSRGNTRELVGLAALVTESSDRLMASDLIFILKVWPKNVDPGFLVLSLRSGLARSQLQQKTVGTSASMQKINQSTIKEIVLAIPPLAEQVLILKNIQEEVRQTEEGIGSSHEAIALLQERRSALISAAVTGQIDVRGLVPEAVAA